MASEKILESKKAKVAALTEKLQNSVSFVLVDYKGITVEEDTKLRKELREAGVSYTVEKNSMLRFALKEMGIVDSFEDVPEESLSSSSSESARTLSSASFTISSLLCKSEGIKKHDAEERQTAINRHKHKNFFIHTSQSFTAAKRRAATTRNSSCY